MKKKLAVMFFAGCATMFVLPRAFELVADEVLFNVSVSFLGGGCESASVMIGGTRFNHQKHSASMQMVEYPVRVRRHDGRVFVGVLDLTQGEAYLRLDCTSGSMGGNGLRLTELFEVQADPPDD